MVPAVSSLRLSAGGLAMPFAWPDTNRSAKGSPSSSVRPRAGRELGDHVDLLSVAPDAQGQPGSGRLPADHLNEIVRRPHLQAGSARDDIPGLQAGTFGDAILDHLVDARPPASSI